jgi:hypothetical protein
MAYVFTLVGDGKGWKVKAGMKVGTIYGEREGMRRRNRMEDNI